jgi:hypothetical protein
MTLKLVVKLVVKLRVETLVKLMMATLVELKTLVELVLMIEALAKMVMETLIKLVMETLANLTVLVELLMIIRCHLIPSSNSVFNKCCWKRNKSAKTTTMITTATITTADRGRDHLTACGLAQNGEGDRDHRRDRDPRNRGRNRAIDRDLIRRRLGLRTSKPSLPFQPHPNHNLHLVVHLHLPKICHILLHLCLFIHIPHLLHFPRLLAQL